MKILLSLLLFFTFTSCSHHEPNGKISVSSNSKGLVKNINLEHPMFITNNINEENAPTEAIKIHQGHFLSINNSPAVNESILTTLENKNFHLVNLTLEDIAVAENQKINFENYKKLIFLNSTVTDTTRDDFYTKANVMPFYVLGDVVFMGLSDNTLDKKINNSRFLLNDYVFSILKIKRLTKNSHFKSYILIHNLQSNIDSIMARLSPDFVNSLAD